MVRIMKTIMLVVVAVLIFLPMIDGQPTIWHNSPKTDNDVGDIFRLKFEILASETTNYTIALDLADKFVMVSGNSTLTINIPKNETRTFIFDIELTKALEDGKHPIYYDAFIEDVKFKSDKVQIRIGEQAPGFEIIALIAALGIAFIIWKRK